MRFKCCLFIMLLLRIYLTAQTESLWKHPIASCTDYSLVNQADFGLSIFGNDTILLREDQYSQTSHFTFCDNELFAFHFNVEKRESLIEVYFRDESGELYHKPDTVMVYSSSYISGTYKQLPNGRLQITPKSITHGEDSVVSVFPEEVIYTYRIIYKEGLLILVPVS